MGVRRYDPMAMLPFCGYNMADYWAHWLEVGKKDGAKLPKIFFVNWFRRGKDDKFLWPGFGENCRVLKWIFERCDGTTEAVDTPIGRLPAKGSLDVEGLDLPEEDLAELLRVDVSMWMKEVRAIRDYYVKFGDHVPAGLHAQANALSARLKAAK